MVLVVMLCSRTPIRRVAIACSVANTTCQVACDLPECLPLRGNSCFEAQVPGLHLMRGHDLVMRNVFILNLFEGSLDM